MLVATGYKIDKILFIVGAKAAWLFLQWNSLLLLHEVS